MIWFGAFLLFLRRAYSYRSMIKAMAIREIQNRYAGTLGGLIWSIAHPLLMILVYWFIFSIGFKIVPSQNAPFVLVFLCGLIPWTLFSETLMTNTNVILANSHLVTKMVFPTEILPLVNLAANLVTHVIMLLILFIIMWGNGYSFSLYNLQFFYYLFVLCVFIVSLSWLLSALNVFFRDIGQVLGVVLNLWFWLTPIVWLMDIIPLKYQFYLNFNPMLYVVEGYRYSFLYHIPFWHNYRSGIYFLGLSLLLFVVGGVVFRRLKPEFPEAL